MKDPVVFIPGLALTADLFADQVAAVSEDRTAVLANHRRHAAIGPMVETLLGELPESFALVGLSMGGYVAFEMVRRAPERVSALVLIDTTARPDAPDSQERRQRMIGIAEAGRFSEIVGLQLPLLLAPERLEDAELVASVQAMHEAIGAESYVRQQRAIMTRADSRPLLGQIGCPTLVIVGDRDQITTPEMAAEMAEGIPGARLVTMPLCGHLSSIERPGAVTHALTDFLDAVG